MTAEPTPAAGDVPGTVTALTAAGDVAVADVGEPGAQEFEHEPIDLGEDAPASTYYPNAAVWVERWLLPHYKRDPAAHRWDPRWWEYTEVVARLEALWRAWEYLRTDGMTGPALFFRDFLDPTMRELTAPDGPFWDVSDVHDRTLPQLWPHEPPPAGLFDDAPDDQ